MMTARARDAGLSIAEAIRYLILHDKPPKKVYGGLDVSAATAYRNLQPLQSNLNQIAHHLNSAKSDEIDGINVRELALLFIDLEQNVAQLRSDIVTAPAPKGDRK